MSSQPDAYPLLVAVRDQLATVPGVLTCRIGWEADITPDDYPLVRIVPNRMRDGRSIGRRSVDAVVFFGRPIHEFENGLEALYAEVMAMESALITAAEQTPGVAVLYRETILDEDRNDAYKLLGLVVEIVG